MNIFEFFTSHLGTIMFIFYSLMISVGCCMVGYIIGSFNCIKDDFKSLDYDNLVRENKQLRDIIEIKKEK